MFFTPPPQNHNLLGRNCRTGGSQQWSDKIRCSGGPTFSFHQKKLENPELMKLGVLVSSD